METLRRLIDRTFVRFQAFMLRRFDILVKTPFFIRHTRPTSAGPQVYVPGGVKARAWIRTADGTLLHCLGRACAVDDEQLQRYDKAFFLRPDLIYVENRSDHIEA